MMLTYHSLRMPGTDFVQELNGRFNQVYAAEDWAEPHYRAGYLLSKRHSIADLEAVRASFGSAGKQADLQSVLAFCQLFLTIAQNGRVIVDKDRHIRNIEHELADARAYREKWGEVAVMLGRIRWRAAFSIRPRHSHPRTRWRTGRGTASPDCWRRPARRAPARSITSCRRWPHRWIGWRHRPHSRWIGWPHRPHSRWISGGTGRSAVGPDGGTGRSAVGSDGAHRPLNNWIRSPTQGAQQLETIRERIDGLQSRLEFQARLDGRMRDLEIGLVTNKRAIQAIYDSRIWKALCAMGGCCSDLPAAAPQRTARAMGAAGRSRCRSFRSSHRGATDDFMALVCDYPGDAGVLAVRDVVEIRGWALAESGIDRVWVQINDDPPIPASYGIPRPDVARSHPGVIGAGQSGYRFFWDTSGLPEGPCAVRVTAVARSGQTREAACNVAIDWKTPPDYGLWIAHNEPTVEDLQPDAARGRTFRLLAHASASPCRYTRLPSPYSPARSSP
jgi:hypothetical protein